MRFALQTNSVSSHQLPLAREIVRRIGAENYRYIYTGTELQGGAQEVAATEPWIVRADAPDAQEWLENVDVLLTSSRDMDFLERRSARGLRTFYQGERWFKPIPLFTFAAGLHLFLPGWVRMWVPRYRRMAKRFVKLTKADANFRVLPIGPWAERDFRRLGVSAEKMTRWGYFVEASDSVQSPRGSAVQIKPHCSLRVLWVGRPLGLKRVDTIRKAVAQVPEATLDVLTGLTPAQVRKEMRTHDVFVFASNAMEGWGAVVSEALTEGMVVLGTYETGAAAALLPKENLFHTGDWRTLAKMLAARSYRHIALPRAYAPDGAAETLMELCLNGYQTKEKA